MRGSAFSEKHADHYNGQMTRQVTATEAKAKILALLDDVAAGDEIEITKHGRTVARLVPAVGPHALRGRFAGVAESVADDEALFGTGVDWDAQ
jgi:prevent-host-death family protein